MVHTQQNPGPMYTLFKYQRSSSSVLETAWQLFQSSNYTHESAFKESLVLELGCQLS